MLEEGALNSLVFSQTQIIVPETQKKEMKDPNYLQKAGWSGVLRAAGDG